MINADAIKWLENLKKDIGNPAYQSLWNYEQALTEIIDLLADHKTEPTISKMEQVDKDINVRSKDEPTTQTETQNSNLTFEKRTMRDCYNCKRYETEGECIECHYEPKDEPQDEYAKEYEELGLRKLKELRKDEPQTEYKKWEMPKADKPTEITTCVQVPASMIEDEPQTDCKYCKHFKADADGRWCWREGGCEKYEPQTDCPWK